MTKVLLISQLLQELPRDKFSNLVRKHQSDKACKGNTSWNHLISMLFCQLGQLNSVRDIAHGLSCLSGNAAHIGLSKVPSKSSLSYLNANRSWELFRDYYYAVLEQVQQQYGFKRIGLPRLRRKVFLLDATVIPLCLSIFDWALFRRRKGAVKLHTVLDYDGCLPVFVDMTQGREREFTVARQLSFPKGSVTVFDRGYLDFSWLFSLDSEEVFFVTRPKNNFSFSIVQTRLKSPGANGIRLDALIQPDTPAVRRKYPKPLRLVRYWDEQQKRELSFLTNNLNWTAQTVADVYKQRWNIEVFFKQIKQQLKIKSFVGTSPNAVLIQVWTAMLAMLLLMAIKSRARYGWNLSNLVIFLRLYLFSRIDLWLWLDDPFYKPPDIHSNQMHLEFG